MHYPISNDTIPTMKKLKKKETCFSASNSFSTQGSKLGSNRLVWSVRLGLDEQSSSGEVLKLFKHSWIGRIYYGIQISNIV